MDLRPQQRADGAARCGRADGHLYSLGRDAALVRLRQLAADPRAQLQEPESLQLINPKGLRDLTQQTQPSPDA
jgi:hypothetical protein